MTRSATRPLDWGAADAADEAIYAAHEDDRPRPNALFDEHGNRKKLDPSKGQDDLIDEWYGYYEANGGEVEDPDAPPDDPPDHPVQPCPEDDELELVAITEWFQDAKSVDGNWESDWKPGDDPMVDRRQYVNERSSLFRSDGRTNHGRYLRIAAEVRWKSGRTTDLAGHTVRFDLEPLPGNRQNLPPDLGHGGIYPPPFEKTTDGSGWTSTTMLQLSQYGGDRFRVRATLRGEGTDEILSGIYTVWRRVRYCVDTMDAGDGSDR